MGYSSSRSICQPSWESCTSSSKKLDMQFVWSVISVWTAHWSGNSSGPQTGNAADKDIPGTSSLGVEFLIEAVDMTLLKLCGNSVRRQGLLWLTTEGQCSSAREYSPETDGFPEVWEIYVMMCQEAEWIQIGSMYTVSDPQTQAHAANQKTHSNFQTTNQW